MASQWLIDKVNGNTQAKTPTNIPVQRTTPQVNIQKSQTSAGLNYGNIAKTAFNVATLPDRTLLAGLGKVGQVLRMPMDAFGGYLSGARKSAEANAPLVRSGQKQLLPALGEDVSAGVKNIIPSVKQTHTTPGDFLTSQVLKQKPGFAKSATSLATDIVADPLNIIGLGMAKYIPKLGGLTKILPKLSESGIAQKTINFAKNTPAIYKPIEATVNPYFRNPEAGKMIEATKEVSLQRIQKLHRGISEAIKELTPDMQKTVGYLIEGKIADTSTVSPNLIKIADKFKALGEQVGKEAVDTGLLNPESYAKYKGNYMSHIWNDITKPSPFNVFTGDIPKISGQFFKKRTGKEGYVQEFAGPIFKGLGTEIKDIEATKLFKDIGNKFGVDVPQTASDMSKLAQKGYTYAEDIAKSRGGDILNRKLLPQAVVDYINKSGVPQKGGFGKAYDTFLNAWKAGKTLYNPAYHIRNNMSNPILASMQTGKNLVSTVIDSAKAFQRLRGKGSQQFVNEATDAGLIRRVHFGEAIDEFLNQGFQKQSKLKTLLAAPKKFQSFSEDIAKLNVFSHFRSQGMDVANAAKKAEEAIFSPYRLAKSERDILGKIFPFYSFTRQAAPFFAKTAVLHPERLAAFPKIENAVQNLSQPKGNEKYLPSYMKGMVRTPLTNKEGQQQYFNPQYFYPWGNFMEESGNPNINLGLGVNPIAEEYSAQKTGIDPYFKTEFVRPGQTNTDQAIARVNHFATTFLPALYRSFIGKIAPSALGKKDYQGRQNDLIKTLIGELTGAKTYPFDETSGIKTQSFQRYQINQEYQSERNRIVKDRSMSSSEKAVELKKILDRKSQRLRELQS